MQHTWSSALTSACVMRESRLDRKRITAINHRNGTNLNGLGRDGDHLICDSFSNLITREKEVHICCNLVKIFTLRLFLFLLPLQAVSTTSVTWLYITYMQDVRKFKIVVVTWKEKFESHLPTNKKNRKICWCKHLWL